ncbi:MAG TPA: hypothetical protein VL362_03365 [Patescibacteria group bacterium]|jgi:hypothetical protein|nr:hypothetical protein [Patescibacteria group bacterium]
MYSFGPIPRQKRSGRVIGTHQKIDRVARRHFSLFTDPALEFPAIRDILHFEGSRGPDGLKLKSPNNDEPKHFIDPANPDGELMEWIRHHSDSLSTALVAGDTIKASFEAAWLAHAVTDGLTPAHHEPYEEQMKELRHPDTLVGRGVKSKVLMAGNTRREMVRNNWQYWGAKGIMTTHTLFEAGVAVAAKPYKFESALPSDHDIEHIADEGFEHVYFRLVTEVASLGMYDAFKKKGWTSQLARQTNHDLLPRIIIAVILAWHDAYAKALKEVKS